jgi:hypothetical protein
MTPMLRRVGVLLLVLACSVALSASEDPPAKKTSKEGLQPLHDLIGEWRSAGQMKQGTKEERDKGFWTEKMQWEWQFKGKDTFLKVDFEKGKYFTNGELRYLPEKDRYQFKVKTPARQTLEFEGERKEATLTLDRVDPESKETQRLVVKVLHANRYIYRYEVKPPDRNLFTAIYQAGATKEGVEFAGSEGKPECIVSGGLGTMAVKFKDKTYYVCCTGCRDAFLETPEKYIKEFEAKRTKKP